MEDKLTRSKKYSAYWHNKASDLMGAAAAVCHSIDNSEQVAHAMNLPEGYRMGIAVKPVSLMLFGMAFEALIKAITVEKGKDIQIKGHGLNSYLSHAEVCAEPQTRKYFDVLSGYITWAGRYPYPKKDQDFHNLTEQVNEVFYDKKPLGNMHILYPNDASGWSAFLEAWEYLNSIYWNEKSERAKA